MNGNTAALAASAIADLQKASGAAVEVNLFHRTEERMARVTALLMAHGVTVLSGRCERLVPLSHDRALCLPDGIGSADLILVPLEDGDRCEALIKMGRVVVTIDLNPLSRTAKAATLTIVDELTRALPAITAACQHEMPLVFDEILGTIDNRMFLKQARMEMSWRLSDGLD